MRKAHLKNTGGKGGPACKGGRSGAQLRGREHFTLPYAEFAAEPPEVQCERCRASKLFAFLQRSADKAAAEAPPWVPRT